MLYKRIRERREQLGMSQEDLAKKMGYKSRSTINKIEMGKNDIPQSKIEQFANALDTTVTYLMGYDYFELNNKESDVENLAQEINNNQNLKNIFDILKKLSPEDLELIMGMIKRISG